MYLKLRIQYDGTGFTGSQLQAEEVGRTVQGELEKAMSLLAGGAHVRVALAGRTDTGVHALGQVASLHFPERGRLDTPAAVQRALNGILPGDLSVASAKVEPEGFHARFSARKRAYRYLFWNAEAPNPLLSRYSLHVRQKLNWEGMSQAATRLIGTHDMAAFAGSGMGVPGSDVEDRPNTVRTMHMARLAALPREASFWEWDAPGAMGNETEGKLMALDLIANAFLPQMVRSIVGTLLEVGQGKRTVEDIDNILESRDRRTAGPTAKPHGLCLLWVGY